MSSSSSTSAAGTVYFSGNSSYSEDLNGVIERSVKLATLPLETMNGQLDQLNSEFEELDLLNSGFSQLESAVDAIAGALEGSSYKAGISNDSVVSASLSNGAAEGVYSISVKSIGAYATSLSTASWDSSSPGGTSYTLTAGGKTFSIAAADNQASTVAAAINQAAGSAVRATVVNVGSASSPDYRISLRAVKLGATTLDLANDGGSGLQTQQTAGSLAEYEVNGSGTTVTSDIRTVTISTGIKLTLLADSGGVPVNVTVTRSTSSLSGALSDFADTYNAIVGELDLQRGSDGGALRGQNIVNRLSRVLSSMTAYSDGSGISLSSLGLELGADGMLTYNSTVFMGTDLGQSSQVTSFFGSKTGSGYLKALTDAIDGANKDKTGILAVAESGVDKQIDGLSDRIEKKQKQIDALTESLTERLSAADSALAALENDYQNIKNLFEAMDTASQSYKN
jgi:flagellar capping protein FliD